MLNAGLMFEILFWEVEVNFILTATVCAILKVNSKDAMDLWNNW